MKTFILGLIVEAVIIIVSLILRQMWIFTKANEVIFIFTVMIGAAGSGLGARSYPFVAQKNDEELDRLKVLRKYAYFAAPMFVALLVNYLYID
ncbi:hypothetical protein [Clostridium manihotivorum]|uniref:Uncharacterized protein n=1 Tax=Clostridium manihotivorum TaxID=2320868 RepID=A0A3R5QVD3_9CLOT|nr:hypothetical protein [Clostridium manihotivorum]QAA30350.1 hypothetical protein C1I91_00870 [Clostridium manihotivorum]